jgi:carbamoyl-phosphate synthase large subunit
MYIHFKNNNNLKIKCTNVYGYIPENNESIITELVFTTSMNGYIETLTDPSYYNQGLVFSFPSIGNYGKPKKQNFYNSEQHKLLLDAGKCKSTNLPYLETNFESENIQPTFIIVENLPSEGHKLTSWFTKSKKQIIEVFNIREIIKYLRDNGTQIVALYPDINLPEDFKWNNILDINYQENVSIKSIHSYPGFIINKPNYIDDDNYQKYKKLRNDKPLLFIDFGCKNSQIREFVSRGINVLRVPWNYLLSENIKPYDIINNYNGIFLSSGPGDPRAEYIKPVIEKVKEILDYIIEKFKELFECIIEGEKDEKKYYNIFPVFGICFGHQILAQTLNNKISKLPYGHRGIHHPVNFAIEEFNDYGFITSQNHGYMVSDVYEKYLYFSVKPLFNHGFDNTNQGLYIPNLNIFSVQFHPEGCPGPKDTLWLFDYFHAILFSSVSINPENYWDIYHKQNIKYNGIPLNQDNGDKTKILVIGSGGLQIGQAGEFDYSCSQAIKSFQSLGYEVILLNPNVASIQTTLANKTYYLPLTHKSLDDVIKKEKPYAIAHTFGGQTALNLIVNHYHHVTPDNIKILGTPIEDCFSCEDREDFQQILKNKGLKEYVIPNISNLYYYVDKIGSDIINYDKLFSDINNNINYPLLLRNSMALGGSGAKIINTSEELKNYLDSNKIEGIELCKSILGWKEIEMEVMRDCYGNSCIICGMENLDPVGVHTGDSVVIAPCQTLDDKVYQNCRTIALKCADIFNLIGEGNVQFAINPKTNEIKIIEMNPRLSRSSALASKASAYPIALIAAKLQLGYSLLDIENTNVNINNFNENNNKLSENILKSEANIEEDNNSNISNIYTYSLSDNLFQPYINIFDDNNEDIEKYLNSCSDSIKKLLNISKKNKKKQYISSFYEPVLDYCAIKFPRWDINKLPGLSDELGPAMKSVGEILTIARKCSFGLYYAIKASGNFTEEELIYNLTEEESITYYEKYKNSTRRWIAIYNLMNNNLTDKYLDINITPFFLKKNDNSIFTEKYEKAEYLFPAFEEIDSFAGEIPTKSNYRYLTYKSQPIIIRPLNKQYKGKIIIIGSGSYRIGSSVEFDWCCVSAAKRARELGYYVVMINNNPETVSTDYLECDCLYMENPNFYILNMIYDIETKLCQHQGIEMLGVIVSMGGQTSNNLVEECMQNNIHIIGTKPEQIINAENRNKFSLLLDKLQIDQPEWINATNTDEVLQFCNIVKYPVIIRPSFVLSGAGMRIVHNKKECIQFLKQAKLISGDYPVIVSKFIENAKEIEVDAIVQNGDVRCMAISEHIEDAGVHSGDATIICPAINLTHETLKRVKAITHQLAIYLEINGPINLQLLAKDDNLKVIELNLRASRSMPFVSRVYKFNFIEFATDIILDTINLPKQLNFNDNIEMIEVPKYLTSVKSYNLQTIGCKVPQFSFHRFYEMNQNLTVEMKSTGEIACFSKDKFKAYCRAMEATGFKLPKNKYNGKLLLICDQKNKTDLEKYLSMLIKNNWVIDNYNSILDNKLNFDKYDLILYINNNHFNIHNIIELKLNKFKNVIRNKKQFKFMVKAICYVLDKI